MPLSYEDPGAGREYADFSASHDGEEQHQMVFSALRPLLPQSRDASILDAGCGDGWFAGELAKDYKNVVGCDVSEELIAIAKRNNPPVRFEVADIAEKIPFESSSFDTAAAILVMQNIKDQNKAFKNLFEAIKPKGKLLVVLPNPYYAYPVGVWKRGVVGWLLGKKPSLKLRPYFGFADSERAHVWSDKRIPLRFSTLSEELHGAFSAGFSLLSMKDLKSSSQDRVYDFNYRSSRFPLLLLLEFQKY